jgi:Leucine-rich repeat (LRR) protein
MSISVVERAYQNACQCDPRLQGRENVSYDDITTLQLSHVELSAIPMEILNYQNLETLYISHSKIETLPSWLVNLPKLNSLTISNSCVSTIEGLPPYLETLDLSHNHLKTLPSLCHTKLKRIVLDHNQIEALPVWPFPATLSTLNLSNNHLRALPTDLKPTAQLSRLDLSHNKLSTLPMGLHAQKLILNGNVFVEVPHTVRVMGSLKTLEMGSNQIWSLPEWLNECTNLSSLAIAHNPLDASQVHVDKTIYVDIRDQKQLLKI